MKYRVQLARLVRQTKDVTIELADGADPDDAAREAYEDDEGMDWDDDCEWGADEGTHALIGPGEWASK